MLAALKGLCPRCGAPTLFIGSVHIPERCRVCGLDYSAHRAGGRPVALLVLLVAALIFSLAMLVEDTIYPPLWVQLVLWPVLTVVAVIAVLRIVKGAAYIRAYRRKEAADLQPPTHSDADRGKGG